MQCPVQNGNPEILLDYSARKLTADTTAVLESHIEVCPECSRFAAAQQRIWAALDDWDAAPVSADFDERLYTRIAADRPSLWSRLIGGEWFAWKPALSLATGCATAALAVVLMTPHPVDSVEMSPTVNPAARFETLEVDQVERTLDDIEMLKQLSASGAGGAQAL